METFSFDLLHFLFNLSAGLVVGGGLALGGAAAPTLFKSLERSRAGTLFGEILARWDGVAILAAIVLAASAALRFVDFEQDARDPRIYGRLVAVAVTLLAVLYSSAWANPIARGLRRQTRYFDELPADAPERRAFAGYHRDSTRAMRVAMLAALAALYLS